MNEKLEEYLRLSIITYRKLSKEEGPFDKLQTREFRRLISELKSFNPETLEPFAPYLLYHNFLHLQEGLSVIGEIPTEINSVLDVGSGLGPFSLAALMRGARGCVMLDQNEMALTVGSELIGKMGYPVTPKKWSYPSPLPSQKFDLVILGYSLFILGENPEALVKKCLERVSDNGYLLIVDSSQPEENFKILKLRDQLVSSGYAIQAPCVWRGPCPALAAKAPCYAQREFFKPHVIREIQRASEINLNSLKMSYLIVKKGAWPVSDEEPIYRVISPPVDGYQGKMYYLCGKGGKKTISSRITEHPKISRAFEYLKRGELITVKNCLESKNHFEIIQDSEVTVKSAVGKPVDELL